MSNIDDIFMKHVIYLTRIAYLAILIRFSAVNLKGIIKWLIMHIRYNYIIFFRIFPFKADFEEILWKIIFFLFDDEDI